MQPRLHGFGLKPENVGGLLDIQALDYAGDENEAERLGQLVDRALDDVLDFALRHGFFRIVGRCERKPDDLSLACVLG